MRNQTDGEEKGVDDVVWSLHIVAARHIDLTCRSYLAEWVEMLK
jgi:hypothetical protein